MVLRVRLHRRRREPHRTVPGRAHVVRFRLESYEIRRHLRPPFRLFLLRARVQIHHSSRLVCVPRGGTGLERNVIHRRHVRGSSQQVTVVDCVWLGFDPVLLILLRIFSLGEI